MAVGQVLDTNVVLYLIGGRLAEPLAAGPKHVSIITELELLSYPNMTPSEEMHIRDLLNELSVVDLDQEVRRATIYLRRAYSLRLPDAIVCATALSLNAVLLTNDKKLASVTEIRVSPVALRAL